MDDKTNRVLAEINAKLPLAELENRLKARGLPSEYREWLSPPTQCHGWRKK
jgi:hypothetical protein